MTEPTLHSLTQRLDRLERERHCWRGASVPHRWHGAGHRGHSRRRDLGDLHTKTGNASISIVRETDQPDPKLPGTSRSVERASLAVDRGVVWLMLNDSTGTARAVPGNTGLRLVAPDVTERRQPPPIVLFDEGGKLLWKAP